MIKLKLNKLLCICYSLVFLTNCQNPICDQSNNSKIGNINFYTLNDKYLELTPSIEFKKFNFKEYYMGPVRDSIGLRFIGQNKSSHLREYRKHDYFHLGYPDSNQVAILIDTTRIIGSENRKKNYPVILKNISKDTLILHYGLKFLAHDGKWYNPTGKTIKEIVPGCGSGFSVMTIPPKEIFISGLNLYDGKCPTKMRIVSGPNYSNEIIGRIDSLDYFLLNENEE